MKIDYWKSDYFWCIHALHSPALDHSSSLAISSADEYQYKARALSTGIPAPVAKIRPSSILAGKAPVLSEGLNVRNKGAGQEERCSAAADKNFSASP